MTGAPPAQAGRHRCPVTLPSGGQCPAWVASDYLMDARHWQLVPRALQGAVYRTWARGTTPDLPAYLEARRAAIEDVEGQLAAAAGR